MNKRKILSNDRFDIEKTLIDDIISLRKQLAQAIVERDNALFMCAELARQKRQLNDEIWALTDREKRENP